MDEEKWFDLIGYEGYYQMNDKDEVKSLGRHVNSSKYRLKVVKERILKQGTHNKTKHKSVKLYKNGKIESIGIAVLKARQFIPNPLCMKVVDHIDGDPTNNALDNLQWITNADNVRKGHYYDGNNKQIKPILQYTLGGLFVAEYRSTAEAQCIFTPTSRGNGINACLKERNKSAYGYIWKYKQ